MAETKLIIDVAENLRLVLLDSRDDRTAPASEKMILATIIRCRSFMVRSRVNIRRGR